MPAKASPLRGANGRDPSAGHRLHSIRPPTSWRPAPSARPMLSRFVVLKKTTLTVRRVERTSSTPDVVAPGVVDAHPAWVAFTALLGHAPKTIHEWQCYYVFYRSVAVALSPTPDGMKWAERAAAPSTWSTDERRQILTDYVVEQLPWEQAMRALPMLSERFDDLTQEKYERAHRRRGPANVAAALSLACGAFGDERRDGESEHAAIRRVAKAFRTSIKRVGK